MTAESSDTAGQPRPDHARREELFRHLARPFKISRRTSAAPEAGVMRAIEMAAFLAGDSNTYHPDCVSSTVRHFVEQLGFCAPDDILQRLLPMVPRFIGTRATWPQEQAILAHFGSAALKVFAPAALRAQGHRRFAFDLQNARTAEEAVMIAVAIRDTLKGIEAGSPAHMAVGHARDAASRGATVGKHGWVSQRWQPGPAPGTSSASAAEQAHLAGAGGWELALDALDAALDIRVP